MDFKNKKLVLIIRILLGLFILFSGVSGLMMAFSGSMEGVPPDMAGMMQVMLDSGLLYLIKITEIVIGLMLLFNLYPALAALFLAPLAVSIVVVNAFLTPAFLPVALLVGMLDAYLGYVYWDQFKAIFQR